MFQKHTFSVGDIHLGLPSSRRPPSWRHPSRRHPSRGHPSQGRPSSRRRRPRRMAQTDIPEMERHEDGGSIRLSFPSRGHPPVPFVSAIPLLQFNSSKYTLAFLREQFVSVQKDYFKNKNKAETSKSNHKTIRIHNKFINRLHTIE